MDGATSNQVSVVSGVPQGSVLGLLLFSIYINGITEVSISPRSYRVLYADDVLLYRGISQPKEELLTVQLDINELEKWSEDQLLQMNPSKCKCMHVCVKEAQGQLQCLVSSYILEEALES